MVILMLYYPGLVTIVFLIMKLPVLIIISYADMRLAINFFPQVWYTEATLVHQVKVT